jgi:undecaprenyl-diphosphatase
MPLHRTHGLPLPHVCDVARVRAAIASAKVPAVHPCLRATAVVAALVAGLLTLDGMLFPLAPFDLPVIHAVQRVDPDPLVPLIHLVDTLTDSTWAPVLWLGLVLTLLGLRRWPAALVALLMPLGGVLSHLISVSLVTRPRPDPEQVLRTIGPWNAPSFPSGHVLGAVLLYGIVAYLAQSSSQAYVRRCITGVAPVMLESVGLGRIWLGAHWPSDVLAAYALGILLVCGLIVAHEWLVAIADQLRAKH